MSRREGAVAWFWRMYDNPLFGLPVTILGVAAAAYLAWMIAVPLAWLARWRHT